jgi:hypothetical protein
MANGKDAKILRHKKRGLIGDPLKNINLMII